MTPLVSVCIPAGGKRVEGFERALASALAQTHGDLEVIVTDESGGALREPAERPGDARVRYHANPHRLGLAANHSLGFDRARGEYIAVLHDDDAHEPGYLETVLAAFERDPGASFVFTARWDEQPDGTRTLGSYPYPAGRQDGMIRKLLYNGLLPSLTVFRRSVWEERGRPLPNVKIGDMALFYDAAVAGCAFHYVDVPLVLYGRHAAQQSEDPLMHRTAEILLLDSYRFADPEDDAQRRARLAEWLRARAATHLRARDGRAAAADLRRALAIEPGGHHARMLALGVLVRAPGLMPLAERAGKAVGVVRR